MSISSSRKRGSVDTTALAYLVVLAGIATALHIWKLPPALPALQAELGLTLVESGFLLSLVQMRSEEHTSELQSRENLVCRLLLEKKKKKIKQILLRLKDTPTAL